MFSGKTGNLLYQKWPPVSLGTKNHQSSCGSKVCREKPSLPLFSWPGEGQGSLVCFSWWESQRVRHNWATEQQPVKESPLLRKAKPHPLVGSNPASMFGPLLARDQFHIRNKLHLGKWFSLIEETLIFGGRRFSNSGERHDSQCQVTPTSQIIHTLGAVMRSLDGEANECWV